METSKRTWRPAIATLLLLFTPLILGGCNPPNQDLVEAVPTLNDSPTKASTEVPPTPTEPLGENQADQIFYNGVLLTMEEGSEASAIAIKDERIMAVGGDEEMLAYAGPETAQIDLEGRTLMPGFVDPHNHAFTNPDLDHQSAQSLALSNGITSLAGFFVDGAVMEEIRMLDIAGDLHMRVSLYPVHVTNCGELLGSWYADAFPVSRELGARLHVTGVKLFNDGGSCNVPAVSYQYPGGIGNGDLYFSVEELSAIIAEVQANGYQAAIHSLGDRAIQVTQDAIEAALGGGSNIFRHRIEHNAVLRDDLLQRYGEIDIVPTIFGAFSACFWGGDTSKFKFVTPEEYRGLEWRWRPLVDQNPDVHFAWHSDYPFFNTIDPFEHLYGFVTRKQVAEDGSICDPPDWAADDVLSVEEVLPMMTIEAAYAIFREDELGSLKTGKLADLIILSHNPLEVDPDAISGIEVLMTMVGGKVEHCAQRHEALCP